MANARLIKRRVNSVQNIAKITKAMQLVSASKTKYSQALATRSLPYMEALLDSLRTVTSVVDPNTHPLLRADRDERAHDLLIVVSTNKGLCGGLNTNLFKKVTTWAAEHPDGEYIAIGQKGVNFLQGFGYNLSASFTDWPEKVSLEHVLPLVDMLRQRYLSGEVRRAYVLFTDFINALKQRAMVFQLLSIEDMQIQALLDEFQAKKSPHRADVVERAELKQAANSYIFEPSPRAVLDFLLNYYLELNFYHLVLEASASEHSARMLAMKSASDNAKELVEVLKLDYNKTRQSMITNELLDMNSAKLR